MCCLVKHNIFLIKPTTIPIPIQHQPQKILQPLLIRIGPNVKGKTRLWNPLNLDEHLPFHFPHEVVVFDFNHISIVDLGQVFVFQPSDSLQYDPYDKVVAATYPGEQQPHIVTYDYWREPCMFRPGDDGWMKIPKLSSCSLGDICNFKGRTCVLHKEEDRAETFMVGPELSVDLVAAELLCVGQSRLCVVESELLLVDTSSCDYDVSIDVYRLDEKKRKWVELTNLGDRVLFLGKKCSFSASASDLGFARGNCVINIDVSDLGCGICDFNLDENEMLPLSDYPNYFKLLVASGLDRHELHLEREFDEDEESKMKMKKVKRKKMEKVKKKKVKRKKSKEF
ncbi:putative F-box protein At5g60060 isoform X2 [Trifolium pratense]|uniref:putative F-box protein At5g60060 isoform X2 n=1 Tax=Trifolium pratense TaxID=57577 RepID=UPI001E692A53|nr:putative F-box protein At5g60060 isoform X2 [Trifolium pratense]